MEDDSALWLYMFCITCVVLSVSQKDPGFDRGQFHKQVAVMRGQVSFFLQAHLIVFTYTLKCPA